jgi:hypothetical protein
MKNLTFKTQQRRDVHIISSRKPTRVITLYSDGEICAIDALKYVENNCVSLPEPGEVVQLKTFLGGSN